MSYQLKGLVGRQESVGQSGFAVGHAPLQFSACLAGRFLHGCRMVRGLEVRMFRGASEANHGVRFLWAIDAYPLSRWPRARPELAIGLIPNGFNQTPVVISTA
jgi:hypothetical protein